MRWEFGTNPVCSVWEPHHPHPVNSIDAAIGQLPFGWQVKQMTQTGGVWRAEAERIGYVGPMHSGPCPSLPIALCVLWVMAWAIETGDPEPVAA